MTKALIIGGGIAGSVSAMAMQRAGIDAVVYEAHVPPTEEVGLYLTVATNGLDALRPLKPINLCWSWASPRPTTCC
jgi:FAD-dependent urate hydroxylase